MPATGQHVPDLKILVLPNQSIYLLINSVIYVIHSSWHKLSIYNAYSVWHELSYTTIKKLSNLCCLFIVASKAICNLPCRSIPCQKLSYEYVWKFCNLHRRPVPCHQLSYKHIRKYCDTIEWSTVTQALVRFVTRALPEIRRVIDNPMIIHQCEAHPS